MTAGDSWDSWLITGLAAHLATELSSLGVAWRPNDDDPYQDGEVGIYDRYVPATPDTVITLAEYVITAGPNSLADVTVGVQVRIRGTTDPQVCRDLGSEIFDLLDSSGQQTWGTGPAQVSVVDVYRPSAASLGQDANDRWEASHNYYVEAMRPTAHRTD